MSQTSTRTLKGHRVNVSSQWESEGDISVITEGVEFSHNTRGVHMTLPKTSYERAIKLFKPDENGFSNWIPVSEFEEAGLNWTKNGNLRRNVAFRISSIKWEVQRLKGPKSEVVGLRMAGWNAENSFDQLIVGKVRNHFENEVVCNFSQLPIPSADREIDHRYGNKNHPFYVSLYSKENQRPEHFQLIHRVLNLQKRQMCVKCVEEEARPPHPQLGFVEGDSSHAINDPCRGCFLAEPERYRSLKKDS